MKLISTPQSSCKRYVTILSRARLEGYKKKPQLKSNCKFSNHQITNPIWTIFPMASFLIMLKRLCINKSKRRGGGACFDCSSRPFSNCCSSPKLRYDWSVWRIGYMIGRFDATNYSEWGCFWDDWKPFWKWGFYVIYLLLLQGAEIIRFYKAS